MRTRHFSLFLSPLSFRNNSPISRANACTRTCYKQHNYKVKPRIKIASLREESVSRVKVNNGRRRNIEFSKWMFAFKKGKKRRGDRKQILHDKNWTLSRRMQTFTLEKNGVKKKNFRDQRECLVSSREEHKS